MPSHQLAKPLTAKYMRPLPPFFLAAVQKARRPFARISETKLRMIQNILWLFADKGVRLGLGLIVGTAVARYLAPEQFGQLNYAQTYATLLSSVATLGLDSIVVRELATTPGQKDEILGTAFILRIAGSLLAIVLAALAFQLLHPTDAGGMQLVLICSLALVFQAAEVVDFWFQAQVQSKFVVLARNTAFVAFALVRFALILGHAPLIAFAWAPVIEVALATVLIIITYRQRVDSLFRWRFHLSKAFQLLKDSWPLLASGVMVSIYLRIDIVILGALADEKSVGIYSAATKLSEVFYFIPTLISATTFPTLVQMRLNNDSNYKVFSQTLFDVSALLAYSASLFTYLLAPAIIDLLYGNKFSGSDIILAVHTWANIFVFLGIARSAFFVNEKLTAFTLLSTFIGVLANIGCNFILVPRLQGLGAAMATVFSYAVSGYFCSFISKATRETARMQTKAILAPFRIVSIYKAIHSL